jgi:acyl-CoA thioesterase FadM
MAREMGIPRDAMLPPSGDAGFPIVGATAQFRASARMDDHLEIRTSVARIGRTSLSFRHHIVRVHEGIEELLATGEEDRVYVRRDGAGVFRPTELTEHMRATLARFTEALPAT